MTDKLKQREVLQSNSVSEEKLGSKWNSSQQNRPLIFMGEFINNANVSVWMNRITNLHESELGL